MSTSTAAPSSDRLKSAGEIALSGLQTTLQVVKDVSNVPGGVPGLAAGIAGLAAILDAVQVHRMRRTMCSILISCGI
jgi:hypothetical protein